jgi:hypothetical protein
MVDFGRRRSWPVFTIKTAPRAADRLDPEIIDAFNRRQATRLERTSSRALADAGRA